MRAVPAEASVAHVAGGPVECVLVRFVDRSARRPCAEGVDRKLPWVKDCERHAFPVRNEATGAKLEDGEVECGLEEEVIELVFCGAWPVEAEEARE